MKKQKNILLLLIIPLFLSTSFFKKINTVEDNRKSIYSVAKGFIGNDPAVYDVRFKFTGYTTFYVGPPDCPVRTNGEVVLSGLLSGVENVNSYDDILYTGILHLTINMDICSVKRVAGEDKFCVMTVTGSGPVTTELELYYNGPGQDSSRGGYIKINYDPSLGKFSRKVVGNCNPNEMVEEENMVPNKTIAAIFNGAELPINTRRLKRGATYVETGPSGKIEIEIK